MKRVLAVIAFDLRNASRDSLILYILAAPVILAVGLRLLAPAVSSSTARFAVDSSTARGMELAAALSPYGEVERLRGQDAVRGRVSRSDDVPGFVVNAVTGSLELVLEGDEDPEAASLYAVVLAAALGEDGVAFQPTVRIDDRSAVLDYGRVFIALLSVLFGGIAAAFALVEEKECKETRAFAVTSLSAAEYFAARGLWAAIAGALGAFVGHAITGGSEIPIGRFALAVAASSFLPLAVCLLIGGLASNQIQAVASLKIVMLVYLSLPVASIFVPQAWRFVFWPLPNYWAFEAFKAAYIPGTPGFGLALGLAAGLGAGLVAALGGVLAPRLSPRRAV